MQNGLIATDDYLDDPNIDAETKLTRLRKQFDDYRMLEAMYNNPREKYQSFLLQAKQVDCNVEKYIIDEIERMKAELER